MKLTLNKDHLNHKAGDEIEVTDQQAEYFKRMGMVEQSKDAAYIVPKSELSNFDKIHEAAKQIEERGYSPVSHILPPAKRGPKSKK